ncbi:MAG: hypothetical protein U0235_20055 [Polyangiaceae bacterium]
MSASAPVLGAMKRRAAIAIAVAVGGVSLLVACSVHASRARAASNAQNPAFGALARALPSPDVALTGGARWLRSVSVEEPGAAGADGIGFPDSEPGSGAISAPRAAYAPAKEPR